MPKGDRLKLKADPEDGTTPIANLLLEAVAMAKLSGLQKGAIVYLWRKTYGWVGDDGKRLKEAQITLLDWHNALDRDKSRISKALSALERMNIISRRQTDQWGGYYYKLNTNIASWNSNSINLAKLSKTVIVAPFTTVDKNATVGEKNNSGDNDNSLPKRNATVDENATQQLTKTQPPTLYKEILNKDKEIVDVTFTSLIGEKVKQVFARIDKLRGYRPPKRKAEATSIIRMLKTYTPDQIIETWQKLKSDEFWVGKELYLMSVESQIGAIISSGTDRQHNKGNARKIPEHYTTPEEFRRAAGWGNEGTEEGEPA